MAQTHSPCRSILRCGEPPEDVVIGSWLPVTPGTSLGGGRRVSQKAGLAIAQSFRKAAGRCRAQLPLDGTRTPWACAGSPPASLSRAIHRCDKGCSANRLSKTLGASWWGKLQMGKLCSMLSRLIFLKGQMIFYGVTKIGMFCRVLYAPIQTSCNFQLIT